MAQPNLRLTHELIRMACAAPSVHNTQPWKWRVVDPSHVELYADRSRGLAALDPRGRDLAISCGAALHHLTVAALGFGVRAEVDLIPEAREPDLLARVSLAAGTLTDQSPDLLAALENRTTDRHGFTDWEVPPGRITQLAAEASAWGARVVPVTEPDLRILLEGLVDRARVTQTANEPVAHEQDQWVARGSSDGIPVELAEPSTRDRVTPRPDRFNRRGVSSDSGRRADDAAVPVLIVTERDDEHAWLQTGQALSALWVRATRSGLSVIPDSQVIENDATRLLVRQAAPDASGWPQLLVRVGWQESSRGRPSHTPRRDLQDVLIP